MGVAVFKVIFLFNHLPPTLYTVPSPSIFVKKYEADIYSLILYFPLILDCRNPQKKVNFLIFPTIKLEIVYIHIVFLKI